MALIKCRKCGQMVSDKADFCSVCGAPVAEETMAPITGEDATYVCEECGNPLSVNAATCPSCGAPVTCKPAPENAVPDIPEVPSSPTIEQVDSVVAVEEIVPAPSAVASPQEETSSEEYTETVPPVVEKRKPEVEEKAELPGSVSQNTTEGKGKKGNIPFALGVLSLLVVCGVLFFLFSSSENEDSAPLEPVIAEVVDVAPENEEPAAVSQQHSDSLALIEQKNEFSTKTFAVDSINFKMIAVACGTFQMGATPEQTNAYKDELPVHSVTLGNYYIGETEVTQGLWQAVMGNNPSYFSGNSSFPVETVSYNDCLQFIDRLNNLLAAELPEGYCFCLPTEAQWEFAARGGSSSAAFQYSGSNSVGGVAWYDANSNGTPSGVMQKMSNALGIYDMSGNVYEWCRDWYGKEYYYVSPSLNPQGPSEGTHRVIRGGSWDLEAKHCRVSLRNYASPEARGYSNGFRLALDLVMSPPESNENVDILEIVDDQDIEIEEGRLASNEIVSEYADYTDTEIIVAEEEIDEDVVFQVVEQQPEFPGGFEAINEYLAYNINYPRISRENGSQGRVFVRFIINTDGSISDAEVIRSSGDMYLDREAVRVLSGMPRWKPGKEDGKFVRVYYTLPVLFKLQ